MAYNAKKIIDMIRRNDSCTIMEEVDQNKMVLDIIKQTPSSFKYANNELKNDIELVTYVVKQNHEMYEFIGESLKNNKELALCALKGDINMIKFVGSALKQDEEFIRYAINVNSIKNDNILNNSMAIKINTKDLKYKPVHRCTEIFFMGQTKGVCTAFSFGILVGSILGYYVSKKK